MADTSVGFLVRMEALPGREPEVEQFLPGGLALVDEEPDKITWYAVRLGPPGAPPRAEVAAALMERNPEGSTNPIKVGSDGIAIGADGERLYYCKLMGRRLYSVSTDALCDRSLGDGAGDGMEMGVAGNFEHDAILRRRPEGQWETVAHDPRLLWPDTLSVAADGHLYVTANQSHRQPPYQGGEDGREKPYVTFRVRIGDGPVELR